MQTYKMRTNIFGLQSSLFSRIRGKRRQIRDGIRSCGSRDGQQQEQRSSTILQGLPKPVRLLPLQATQVDGAPAHEVVFGTGVSVPNRHLHLVWTLIVQVQVEL